jgi:predicted acetyltransferase
MPVLVVPRLAAAASVRAAAREHGDDPLPAYSSGVADLTDEQLAGYVDGLLADTREHAPRPEGYVPSTHLWWLDGDTFLGRVHIRHRLTPFLREVGATWVITWSQPIAAAGTPLRCFQPLSRSRRHSALTAFW